MINKKILNAKLKNIFQTAVILSAMAVLCGFLGWTMAGTAGLYAAIGVVILGLFFNLAPSSAFIMRLYGARPLQTHELPGLYGILHQLARNAGLEKPPVLYYSRQRSLNAFATGGRKDPAIAVTQGLLDTLSETEMAGILGHEVAHIKHNDTTVMALAALFRRMTRVISLFGISLLILMLPLVLTGQAGPNLSLFMVLLFAPVLSTLLQLALSRTREYEADLGSAVFVGSPFPLAKALHTIEQYKHRVGRHFRLPTRMMSPPEMLSTHPDTGERIRRLAALAGKTPQYRSGRTYMASRPILIPMDSAH